MFASKFSSVIRRVNYKAAPLGRYLLSHSVQPACRMNYNLLPYRLFSSVTEDVKNANNEMKNVKEVEKKVIERKQMSKVRQTIAGVAIGFAASALGSLVGLGGGFIIIPLLTSVGGMTQHQAAACSLASICINAISGTSTYVSQGLVDIPAALVITATSMIMARFGSRWSHHFESKKLKHYYGWMCLIVAPLLPIKNRIMKKRKEEEAMKAAQIVEDDLAAENAKFGYRDCLSREAFKESQAVEHTPLLLTLGLIAGTMSGFFGVGGGIIVTPSLCLFTKMAGKKIMGTSLASMIVPTSISAGLSYKAGNLMLGTALPICCGSILGGYVGSKVAGKTPVNVIQWVLMGVLMFAGFKSIL